MVTGGHGFIGSHLVKQLKQHEVTVLDNLSTQGGRSYLDVSERWVWSTLKPDCIIALACAVRTNSLSNPVRDMEVNYQASIYGLECARRNNAMFIFASNSGIVGTPSKLPVTEFTLDNPTTPYDNNKLATEHLMKIYSDQYGVRTLALRFAAVYGESQICHLNIGWHPLIPHFTGMLQAGKVPTIDGDGNQTRNLIYVSDIVNGIILGIAKLQQGELSGMKLILGDETETSINQVFNLISEELQLQVKPNYGVRRAADITRMCFDSTKTKALLGWTPKVSPMEGIKRTVKSLKRYKCG